jgi:stringent starvation protein B
VSASATRRLTIDNDWIQFTARFNGVSQEVAVPMAAVGGIFAKETGYGFAFNVAQDPVASLAAATAPADDARKAEGNGDKARARPSHLQVVK